MKIILASASPRRRELLSQIVEDFEIIPAKGEECADRSLPPECVACQLAENKCDEVFQKNNNALVIACDTIVVYNNTLLGKPKSAEDAASTLRMLSGKTHSVITGVCVRRGNKKITQYERTEVRFNNLSEQFIRDYVAGGSPMDKAGSYGIQDGGVVQSYSGSYTNVVGLPVELVKKIIEEVLADE
ncbi:MAG: Maf family protein [Clostridia bacterium]|nr:Maf family protein [Clostridia bacterium]